MSAPRKYDEEFRDRAVRMYRDRLAEPGETKLGARRHVGSLLDLNQATLRNWVEERHFGDGTKSGSGRGSESDEVRALKKLPGRDIVVTGSIKLCHALITAGLVDEYRLFVYPIVQGRGRRLFPEGVPLPRLRLLDAKAFRSGVTYSCYAPA